MKSIVVIAALALGGCASTTAGQVYTSTREVTDLATAPDGSLWAATTGGVLRRAPDGTWRKWTRADGLPSHEAQRLTVSGNAVSVRFPTATVAWDGERWTVSPAPPPAAPEPRSVMWKSARWTATPLGLTTGEGISTRSVPLPPSRGTHISALLVRDDALWAALYGDGLWRYDGKVWRALDVGLPPEAREMTAMAALGDDLWLGTRRQGLWRYVGKAWTGVLQPDEPFAHNIQALAAFAGQVYASTLEDGLLAHGPGGWRRLDAVHLSSDAPRQMAVFGGKLYVRHGNGQVDAFDGTMWEKAAFAALPRKQVSALAADGERLYLAQWGGWSEWDGKALAHHLRIPSLQGVPVTALLPDGGTLWVGTQGKGLAEVDRAAETVRWHDARHGLPDDWITALAKCGETMCAGTFVGGLAQRTADGWTTSSELAGRNVTALEPDGNGGLFVATRNGLYRMTPDGSIRPTFPDLDPEVQALCLTEGKLWIGTRTGLRGEG